MYAHGVNDQGLRKLESLVRPVFVIFTLFGPLVTCSGHVHGNAAVSFLPALSVFFLILFSFLIFTFIFFLLFQRHSSIYSSLFPVIYPCFDFIKHCCGGFLRWQWNIKFPHFFSILLPSQCAKYRQKAHLLLVCALEMSFIALSSILSTIDTIMMAQ